MNIYVDYDELLVFNDIYRGGGASNGAQLVPIDGTMFECKRRPMAQQILDRLAPFGKIIILTSGEREYVVASSKALGFNFEFTICREEFLKNIAEPFERPAFAARSLNVDPKGVLIEHTNPFDPNIFSADGMLIQKMKFLGISKERVLLMDPYFGQLEGKKANNSLNELIVDLEKLTPQQSIN